MQRRELVRTGLFGVAAAAAGAAHAAQDAAPAKKRLSENWDVVVVGAGFAGMCAALEAAEQGAKTVLLEKMNRPDGATVYSSGWIAAVGSRFQKNHPEDSPKAFFEDMMRLSHQRSDPELIKVYAEESGAGIDWLADHGTPFYLWEGLPAPELSRCLISPGEGITGGSKLIRCLMAALERRVLPFTTTPKLSHSSRMSASMSKVCPALRPKAVKTIWPAAASSSPRADTAQTKRWSTSTLVPGHRASSYAVRPGLRARTF